MATETIESLKYDHGQWRKGVALIASALGDTYEPQNLCCVRIADIALNMRAENERLCKQLYEAISGGTIDTKECNELLEGWCKANGI